MLSDPIMGDLLLLAAIGFAAQLVDGALGLAFGTISASAMLAMGVPPANASAIVHTAEIFTTAASGASHVYHRNVDWRLMARLGGTGVLGAILGAWVLSNMDASIARPFVTAYLCVMGLFILAKALRRAPRPEATFRRTPLLGFAGGVLDASGGGGWGPVVTSTLIGSGHAPRTTVGSVNTTEFFVTTAAATTFFIELDAAPLGELVALTVGGCAAAPLGGWVAKRVPARALMVGVGTMVFLLSAWQFLRAVKLV